MFAWPMFITGIVLIVGGLITAGIWEPSEKQRDDDNYPLWLFHAGFIVFVIGILQFCASFWVGFGLERWGQ